MEIEIIRKKRKISGEYISETVPYIVLSIPRGEIRVLKKTMEILGLKKKSAVMFGFNKKKKLGYLFKEKAQKDSYYITTDGKSNGRFTSKVLAEFMVDVFEFGKDVKQVYFRLSEQPNEKGMYSFKVSHFIERRENK